MEQGCIPQISSDIVLSKNSTMTFKGNQATIHGGGIYITKHCNISFGGNSLVALHNNTAKYGGAIISFSFSHLSFHENSTDQIPHSLFVEIAMYTALGKEKWQLSITSIIILSLLHVPSNIQSTVHNNNIIV